MIRMASHDIRNPLGNAMAYFELLMMQLGKAPTPQQKDYMDGFRSATEAMVTLIDDLLTLERAESERQSSWKRFDISQLIQDAVTAQKLNADLKGHTLTLKIDREHSTDVMGSATQLRQAVANLVGNAIKYTPEGGRVDVQLSYQNQRLMFEVKDNGYGISKERQARLFERFYRAREPSTDHISGTGLGLSLVKTVIERHNGKVWVESEVGTGSTFGFWLPAADPEQAAEPTTTSANT
jgi:signal transduction histidine kinase